MQKSLNLRVIAPVIENREVRRRAFDLRQVFKSDIEARQHIRPSFVRDVGIAPQKRGDGELQTRAKMLPLVFVAAKIVIDGFNRNVVETKVGPIEPTA